jgi:hypothetical protein
VPELLTVIVVALEPADVVIGLPPTVEPAGRFRVVPLTLIATLPIQRALAPSERNSLLYFLVKDPILDASLTLGNMFPVRSSFSILTSELNVIVGVTVIPELSALSIKFVKMLPVILDALILVAFNMLKPSVLVLG